MTTLNFFTLKNIPKNIYFTDIYYNFKFITFNYIFIRLYIQYNYFLKYVLLNLYKILSLSVKYFFVFIISINIKIIINNNICKLNI